MASAPRPEPSRAVAWRDTSKLLAVRLDNLGDLLMTTPALKALGADQNRRISLLSSRAGAAAQAHLPFLDDVLVHDAPWVRGEVQSVEDDRRFLSMLTAQGFDAAVIFTVCTQSALPAAMLLRLAGIPLRLAYSRENPYALLTDVLRDTETVGPGMRHEVQRQLDLVASVGFGCDDARLSFDVLPQDRASMRAKLAAAGGQPGRPWIVVHPGSTAASRRYPPERFGIAAGQLARRSSAQVVFAGGPGELAACATAMATAGTPCVGLAGLLSLGELAALIDEAGLLVCNNSGPAHLAAATGTPVVVLYALTNPQHTPWSSRSRVLFHDVPCRDCLKSVCPQAHHACLLGVDPLRVVEAGLALWHEGRRAPMHAHAGIAS